MKHIALIIALAIILSVNLSNAESLAPAELYVGILEDYPTINHGSAIEHNFWAKKHITEAKKSGYNTSNLETRRSIAYKKALQADTEKAIEKLKTGKSFKLHSYWVKKYINMEIDAGIDPTVISNHQAELDAQISHFGILTLNIHIVRPNETFSQICEEITGKGNYKAWKSEAIKMGLKNPKLIHPGDVLVFSKS